MKVIGIISSPHRDGNTATLVRDALGGARVQGAEIEEIYLPDYDIQYCRGCMSCMARGRCGIADDFEEIREKVYAADGLIIGSPSYGIAPNAIYKNFLDRIGMYSVYTSSMSGKYVAGISTAAAIGAGKVARKLTELADGFFARGYVSGTLGAKAGWEGVRESANIRESAARLGGRVARDIARGRRYPLQGLFKRFLQKIILRRLIKNNILQNRETRMKAVYENLLARHMI